MAQHCGNCGYAWRRSDGNVGCGAPFAEDEIRRPDGGNNPVWAVRKYGPATVIAMLSGRLRDFPAGSNAENLSPSDGVECRVWRAREIEALHMGR